MGKDWADYQDSYGLVTQKQSMGGDAGDSLNRSSVRVILTAWAYQNIFQLAAAQELNAMIYRNCEVTPGVYCRNPDVTKWYSGINRTSKNS